MLKLLLFLLLWIIPLAVFVIYVWWEHKTKKEQSPPASPGEERLYYQYREFLNDRVGFFSFTFALASLGTDSPQFYALLSLWFVIVIWVIRAYEFRRVVKLWREEKSWRLSVWSIVKQFPVFMFGYLTLLFVLFGWLEKGSLKTETANAVTKFLSFL